MEKINVAGIELSVEQADEIQKPNWFIEHILGCRPWALQAQIVDAINTHKHVAVRSCHGAGKDWIAARIVLQFLHTHDPVRIITTGPTDRQVRGILWKEIAIAYKHARCDLIGRLLTQEYHIADDRFAIGFTTSPSARSGGSRFQGWHSRNILVIIDEASGVDPDVYTEVSGVLSSENAHLLEIGNPTNPTGEFAASFKSPGVHKIKISAFDTPNFTAYGIGQEDIENDTWREKITGPLPYPELITPEWVAERYQKWGQNNPLYQSRVLAEFPSSGVDSLIPLYQIEAAHQRNLLPIGDNVIAVDVARYGANLTVIAHRRGPVIRILLRIPRSDLMEVVGHVVQARKQVGADRVIVDVVGLGGGVVDRLAELGEPVVAASGGSAPHDTDQYVNARAEWYCLLRDAIESGTLDLDSSDEDLTSQLADIKWKPDSKGRTMIESKEDMLRRGVQSPDDADAAAMTFCRGTTVPKITTLSDAGISRNYHPRHKKIRW